MSWDNDHSVIVNWHKGDLYVYAPKDENSFRHMKYALFNQLEEKYQYCGTDGVDPNCRDVVSITVDALKLYFAHKEI